MAHKMSVTFSKTGDMRFVSHLDLMRLFQRASRRAGLPVAITQGYNPHLKISITKALKLGLESGGEDAVFYMDTAVEPHAFTGSINAKLPDGVKVLSASQGEG